MTDWLSSEFFMYSTGCIAYHIVCFQPESGDGNCLFRAIKASLGVHHARAKDSPYYPTRYFCWQVVTWMVKHCQLVYKNKYLALMANYGLAEETPQFKGPLSFKDYLCHILHHDFWGDEIVLYVISCMWCLQITVVNSHTLEDYCIHPVST